MTTKDDMPPSAGSADASQRLWQADHPYYCNQGNYFKNGCVTEYGSWGEFVAAEGDSDFDMNLVFRWDWYEGGFGGSEYTGDDYYRNGLLLIFWMGQRKGLYRWSEIEVCRADEPAVRAWLTKRWEHMRTLWAPFASKP